MVGRRHAKLEGVATRLIVCDHDTRLVFVEYGWAFHRCGARQPFLAIVVYLTGTITHILQPVLVARLGVHHEVRNFFWTRRLGNASKWHGEASSLYGPDVDLLLWEPGMTEKQGPNIEVMARQAILGGTKGALFVSVPK